MQWDHSEDSYGIEKKNPTRFGSQLQFSQEKFFFVPDNFGSASPVNEAQSD